MYEKIQQLFNTAVSYHQQGKLAQAKAAYLELVAQKCDDDLMGLFAETYNNLAIIEDLLDDYHAALLNYSKAVNLKPDYIAAHQNLGILLLKHQELAAANTQFHNVIALNPDSIAGHYYLANIALEQNDLATAKLHNERILEIDSEHSEALNNLGVICLKENKAQLAIDYFTKALACNNENWQAKNNLAATFMQHERYENALTHYAELLPRFPDNDEYNYNSGVAHMALGYLQQAISEFECVLAHNDKNIAALTNLAAIYMRLQQREQAKQLFTRVLELQSDNRNAQYMLAALNHRGDFSQAPLEYVTQLFDNYAEHYDQHLMQRLHYQVPQAISAFLRDFSHPNKGNWQCLDLGCGTGLSGAVLKPYSQRLIGVDLSEKMLAVAKKTQYYDELYGDEINSFLQKNSRQYDCICAADVLGYFGDLTTLFSLIKSHLALQGIFIFSMELTEQPAFELQTTARFAHNPDYIALLAQQCNLKLITQQTIVARIQEDKPLPAMLVVLG